MVEGDVHHDKEYPDEGELKDSRNGLYAAAERLEGLVRLLEHTGGSRAQTRTLQHLIKPHCMTVLFDSPSVKSHSQPETADAHMFSIADAEDVLPRRRNHGLKPSDDFAE